MKHEVIERLETLLRDEGFTNLTTLRASHDVTISATKGDTRLVTHLSERAYDENRIARSNCLEQMRRRAADSIRTWQRAMHAALISTVC